jgi:hypothetical protein
MSQIPGADVLGFGFNILGEYDVNSVTSQIFTHQNMDARQWTYQGSGITYQVPDNTSVFEDTSSTGASLVFDTREQFQSYFSTKSSASLSYGAFSGQFNMAYAQTVNTDVSYYYTLYDAEFTAWQLVLSNQSSSWLSPDFVNDPDVASLPSTFTPENQEQFFQVFRKYGTHYVSAVTVGGSLDYYLAVERSFSSNEQTIDYNVALEYKAVFTSAKAESQAQWQQLGQNWASSRSVRVDATGGDNSMLNVLNPTYGYSDVNVFQSWLNALMNNPTVMDFTLRPLNLLFTGAKANAVAQALEVYTNGAILAMANSDYTPGAGPDGCNFTTASTIVVNGMLTVPQPPVTPPPPAVFGPDAIAPVGGYQLALLDPSTYAPIMSHIYYQIYPPGKKQADPSIYGAMLADINTVTARGYVAVLSGFAIDLANPPTTAFAQWLSTVGAMLAGWKQFTGWTSSSYQASYVCIGKQGFTPGRALEAFATAAPQYPWAGTTASQAVADVSGLALTYAASALELFGPDGFRSLVAAHPELAHRR